MSEYQSRVSKCIDDKLVGFAMESAHSLYNIDILYHYHVQDLSKLFYNPFEHYTKIMALAYRKTLKEYTQ